MKNDKKIRREDVAVAAGVSKAVVTWVMDGSAKDRKISDETIKKVKKIVKDLNYRPSIWGKLINTQKSGLVAFISSDLSDPNAAEIIRNLNLSMRKKNYVLMLFDLFGAGKFTKESFVKFEDSLADAFILHAPGDDILKFSSEGRFAGKPLCVLGRNMKDFGSIPSVEVDNAKGAEMALRLLFKNKVARLGIMADHKNQQYTQERLGGCRKFLESEKVKTCFYFRKAEETQYEAGANAVTEWKSDGNMPDAIFAMGDAIALGALSQINNSSLECPENVKIVGFDGAAFAGHTSPPLTTIRQPFERMCEKVTEICIAGINGEKFKGEHFLFEPELQIRKTAK